MQPQGIEGKTPDSFEMEFKGGRKALFANPRNIPFRIGDFAVVDVERGHDIGRIVREGSEVGALRHLRLAEPAVVVMSGTRRQGIVLKPGAEV